jgi:hypothetical protein
LGCFKKWGIELLCMTLSIVSEDLEMEIVLMSAWAEYLQGQERVSNWLPLRVSDIISFILAYM